MKKIIKKTLILLDRFIPVFLLLVILNLSLPQITLASGIDAPSPPELPYRAGKEEYFISSLSLRPRLPLDLTGAKRESRYTLKTWVTAYNSHPWQTDLNPCITASGLDVCERAKLGAADIAATNFKYLPFGTKIEFPEIFPGKIFMVEDRMNARYWNVFDVWLLDYQTAKQFGRKWTIVKIY